MGEKFNFIMVCCNYFFICHFILKLCSIKVKHRVNYPKSVFGFSHFTNED